MTTQASSAHVADDRLMFGIGQIPNGKARNDLDVWLDEAPAWDDYVDLEEVSHVE